MRGSLIRNTGSELVSSGPAQTLSVTSGAAVGFTAAQFPPNAQGTPYKYVMIQIQANTVRVGYGADTPTASIGQRRLAGDDAIFTIGQLLDMLFIAEGSTATIWALPCNLG